MIDLTREQIAFIRSTLHNRTRHLSFEEVTLLCDMALRLLPSATAAPLVEEKAVGHARYAYLRTLNPRKFSALYNEAMVGVHQFDDLVDRYRMKGQPDRPDWAQQLPGAELYDRDHGYDRTASLSAGHYVCTCAAGRVLHEKTCATRRHDAGGRHES